MNSVCGLFHDLPSWSNIHFGEDFNFKKQSSHSEIDAYFGDIIYHCCRHSCDTVLSSSMSKIKTVFSAIQMIHQN